MADIDWDAVIRDLSRPGVWRKGSLGDPRAPHGQVCLRGAIYRALDVYNTVDVLGRLREARVAEGRLRPIIAEQFPERVRFLDGCVHVPSFNDDEDTTLDDVILVCEKARAES